MDRRQESRGAHASWYPPVRLFIMGADVLVYRGEVLTHDLEVTGPVALVRYVRCSARYTDFTAKLLDVHPDGRAMLPTDGILRARYREGFEQPRLMTANEICRPGNEWA